MAKKKVETATEAGLPAEEVQVAKATAPEATGKFYAFEVEGGFRVVGKRGEWVSGVLPESEAGDIAVRFNRR